MKYADYWGSVINFQYLQIRTHTWALIWNGSQSTYIGKLVKKFSVDLFRIVRIPMDPNSKLAKAKSGETILELGYKELIGALIYISTCTRPDVAFAVSKHASFFLQAHRVSA